jgi:hypothetical protein
MEIAIRGFKFSEADAWVSFADIPPYQPKPAKPILKDESQAVPR